MAGAGRDPRAGTTPDGATPTGTTPDGAALKPAAPEARVVTHLRSGLSIRLTEADGRVSAAVLGEIDLDCASVLEHALLDGLRSAPDGLDVDLAGVRFFDCAGLNALLRVCAAARRPGARMTLTALSPAVARVLDLTRTRAALPLAVRPGPSPSPAPSSAATAPAVLIPAPRDARPA